MLADFGVDVAGRFMVSHTRLCDWATYAYCQTPVEEIHRMSTANVFLALFGCVLGYYSGVSFRGFHPFKMLFGLFTAYLMWDFYQQKIGTLLIVAYVIGFVFSLNKPFRSVYEMYDSVKLDLMLRKAYKKAKNDNHSKKSDNVKHNQYADENIEDQKEELRQQQEALRREREQFETEMRAAKNGKRDRRAPEEILGVNHGFTLDDLKMAKKRKVAKLHSDKWQDMPIEFIQYMDEELKKVLQAYEVLSSRL